MRAAIYTRVSTEEQAQEGLSLGAQEKVLRKYCADSGLEISDIYADEGISGKDIRHRPHFMEMMAAADRHEFDVIVIWKLSRFSRSTLDLLQCCKRLEKSGVALKSYSEQIDTSNAMGNLLLTILGAVAQFERDTVSENVKMVAAYRARQGKRTCSEVLGYYRNGKDSLRINPEEAEIVSFIFKTFIECHSLTVTAEKCKRRGYRGKRGGEMRTWHIERILTCPIHAGFYTFHSEVFKGNFEPIISIDDFNLVQIIITDLYARKGRVRKKKLYILQ